MTEPTEPTEPTQPAPQAPPAEPAQPPIVAAPPPAAPAPTSWTAPEPTPGPAPGVEFAEPGARLVGYIIDIVINVVIVLVLSLVAGLLVVTLPVLSILPILAIIIIPLIYFPFFWSREGPKNGQTPGMQQMGIRVVRDTDGGPITIGPAVLRLIGYWISGLVFYIGYIWIFVDKRRRGWFDLIAGTVVVKA
jgi:uncharacterized RDD family membrane protein YckC